MALRARGLCAFEELPPRTFWFSSLCGRPFLNWYQFIAELLSLTFEFRFEPFFSCGIPFGPNRRVVFRLVLHHRVEDDCDFVGRRRGRCGWSEFTLHAAQVVSQRRLVVMQRIGGQSKQMARSVVHSAHSPPEHPSSADVVVRA